MNPYNISVPAPRYTPVFVPPVVRLDDFSAVVLFTPGETANAAETVFAAGAVVGVVVAVGFACAGGAGAARPGLCADADEGAWVEGGDEGADAEDVSGYFVAGDAGVDCW